MVSISSAPVASKTSARRAAILTVQMITFNRFNSRSIVLSNNVASVIRKAKCIVLRPNNKKYSRNCQVTLVIIVAEIFVEMSNEKPDLGLLEEDDEFEEFPAESETISLSFILYL
jgi:hypothetical protein